MVIDELIVRKGTTNMPIDSYDNKMIDEIVYEGQSFHFAKQKDITGTTEIVADNGVQEPLVSLSLKGNTIQSLLPPEYQQVEYIESTGTQWIDTGVIPRVTGTKQTSIEITYQYTNLTPSFVFGSRTATGVGDYFYHNRGSAGKFGIYIGNGGVSVAYDDTNIHTMNVKSDRTVWYDGQQVKISYESFTGTYSVYLFACNQAGSAYLPSQIKLYSCTMTDANRNLVRDFAPCYRKSDGEIGLYDLANDVFYTNQGTGTFKKGNDYNQIPTPEAPIPIQNTGDNGVEVELSGVNLLDNGSARFTQYATFKKTETGFEIISNPTNNVVYVILREIEAEAGKKYYIDFDCSFLNSPPTSARPNELHIRASNNEGTSVSGDTLVSYKALGTSEQTTHKRFSITMPSGYKYLKLFFYGSLISTSFVDYKAIFTNFIVSKDEAKPYEPYFNPVTVNIPSEVTLTDGTVVPLLMGEGDKIVLSRNKVTYIENGWQEDISTRTFVDRTANSTFTDGRMWFQPSASGIPLSVTGKGLCNILGRTDTTIGDYNHFRVSQYGNSMALGLITTGFSSFAEFNTWKETNPIIVRLQRVTPIEYDLTDTDLGEQLLALATEKGTNILTITSEIPVSQTDLSYWRQIIPNE